MHTSRDRIATAAAALLLIVGCSGAARAADLGVPEGAFLATAEDDGEPRLEAQLLLHPDDDPATGRLRAGVLLEPAPGWHIYGRDPGDTGLPTRVAWQLLGGGAGEGDAGGAAGPLAWPEPRVFHEDGLVTYGYAEPVLLTSELRPDGAAAATGRVRAEVEALVCEARCIPARFTLERALGSGRSGDSAATRALFAATAASAPAAPDAGSRAPAALGLLGVLALAFLGGVVLNLMPCVLPVLAIKVFAVAELAGRGRREVLRHAAAYTSGIAASMLALAGVVAALRLLGRSVGWGFQFQEPIFLALVAGVVLLFGLNLLGVYEIGLDTGRLARLGADAAGARRSFFEGLLAVALATPCSAPFLGTAVGFAFAGSTSLVFGVFLAVGFGLAAPFVLVTLVPGGARLVPRSGPWMLHVRGALGFLLLATVVWLLWILGRVAGAASLVAVLVLLWLLGLSAWLYGRLQAGGREAAGRGVAALAALALLLGANSVSVRPSATGARASLESLAYDRERVAARVATGRPAFVFFTADWCITCKANERLVLRHPRVLEAFEAREVGLYRADWTRRDEAIRAELERFGRASVPLYLWYPASPGAEPVLLPELLTPELVITALGSAPRVAHR